MDGPGTGEGDRSVETSDPVTTAAQSADGSWAALAAPSGRYGHSAIYDSRHDRMIVFGGWDGDRRNEVWSLSLNGPSTWTLLAPSGTAPSRRYAQAAIYDSLRDRMIVFGGDDGHSRNDVWALSLSEPTTWSQIVPAGGVPPGRFGHTAIYDAAADRMIIFGGKDSLSRNDTWALALSGAPTWSELAPDAPLAKRYRHAAIYDPPRNRMVIFGGRGDSFGENLETWALALSGTPTWSQLAPFVTPPAREGHAAIYDAAHDRMIVFGGHGHPDNAIWTLPLSNPSAWSSVSAAGYTTGRYRHTAIYDPLRGRMVVYGGDSYIVGVDAVSLGENRTWTRICDTPVHLSATAIYDPVRDRTIVYGVGTCTGTAFDDAWELSMADPSHWLTFPTVGVRPAVRIYHTAIYDPVDDRMIIFGGYGYPYVGYLNDTWALTLSGTPTWAPIATQGTPPGGRIDHTAIYDPVRRRMIVFGGRVGDTEYPVDVWQLSLLGQPTWTQLAVQGPSPPIGTWNKAIYDPVRDRMIVFVETSTVCDVWAMSLSGTPTWSQIPTTGMGPHQLSAAFYDPMTDGAILSFYNRVWRLNLTGDVTWTALLPTGTPPAPRDFYSAAFDPRRNRMLLYGGGPYGDTWTLTWPETAKPSVTCSGDLKWNAGSTVHLSGALVNPLPGARAIEWTLTDDRGWPGLPSRGIKVVGGSAVETLTVDVPVPDSAAAGVNAMRLSAAFAGAAGNESACEIHVHDATTGVLASLVSADVGPDAVHMTWQASGTGMVTVYRRGAGTPWGILRDLRVDGSGYVTLEDRTVQPGERYGYQLRWTDQRGPITAGEVWVDVPSAFALALHGVRPNPVVNAMAVSFSLPTPGRPRLELYDMSGRRVGRQELEMGPGYHLLHLDLGTRLSPGVYMVRLSFKGKSLETRAVVMR